MQQLPTTFWPQLFARLEKDCPQFYRLILKNSLLFSLAAALVPIVVTQSIPAMGLTVPPWLDYLYPYLTSLFSALSGAGLGAAAVAKTTIQTPDTPPLNAPVDSAQ